MDHSIVVTPSVFRKIRSGHRKILIVNNFGLGIQMGDVIDLEADDQPKSKFRIMVTDFTNECLAQNWLAVTFKDANGLTDEELASRSYTSPQTRNSRVNTSDLPEHIRNRCATEEDWELKKDYLEAIKKNDYKNNSPKQKAHVKKTRAELEKIEERFTQKHQS